MGGKARAKAESPLVLIKSTPEEYIAEDVNGQTYRLLLVVFDPTNSGGGYVQAQLFARGDYGSFWRSEAMETRTANFTENAYGKRVFDSTKLDIKRRIHEAYRSSIRLAGLR